MILTGEKIMEEVKEGNIVIDPFKAHQITTNSYDLTLWNTFIKYTCETLDPKVDNPYELFKVEDNTAIKMNKGDFILGASKERVGSTKYVPIIHNKSSIARLWLFVHITADLIDIGSIGTTTFQLYATLPITLYPWMLIGQVTFWKTFGEIKLYEGKYQNSSGPLSSKSFIDYSKENE